MTEGSPLAADQLMMPPLGFGTWQLKGDDAYRAVSFALETGYRHLDTATLYGNEDAVGKALAASGLPRDEVFVTTRFAQRRAGGEPEALERSLDRLGLERVDLWLVLPRALGFARAGETASPLKDPGENAAVWDAFLAAAEEGLATDVGVSNHSLAQLDALTAATGDTPPVNQIRLNPPLYDAVVVEGHRERGVLVTGHSPLRPRKPGLAHPTLTEIAAAYEASPAQIVIAWHVAHRIPVIPKSGHPERIFENFLGADLELDAEDVARIDSIGQTGKTRSGRPRSGPRTTEST
ncbi:putative oxidoreductase [Streptomyces sp. NBRC 110611]|uniref:aldo/keto reductase n=1 Tax=Streptomyces sp. NBRC 110611 TaxID=1621259 RepID=UPI0008328B83|nr:aldo/keto reductase [Streptomyces sp. NBRC 110611]GAU65889.1 putative oxidoreductase [Streptomyces sp. NBRC 110611]